MIGHARLAACLATPRAANGLHDCEGVVFGKLLQVCHVAALHCLPVTHVPVTLLWTTPIYHARYLLSRDTHLPENLHFECSFLRPLLGDQADHSSAQCIRSG